MVNLEFSELVKVRRSVHYYTDEKVTDEELNYILEAARWAPSAGNCQPWRFIVVRDEDIRLKIGESTTGIQDITPQNFIRKAPVHIIVLTDSNAYKGRQSNLCSDIFSVQDSSAAIMNMLLAVADSRIGACWGGMFREEALRDLFKIPEHIKPVAIIPIGHTKSKEKPRKRKPLNEIVFHEKLG